MSQIRSWQDEKRKAAEAEINRLTAGDTQARTRFVKDRVREIYRARLEAGDTAWTASKTAWLGSLEECQEWAADKGRAIDPDARFHGKTYSEMEGQTDIGRDLEWVLEHFGCTNVRKGDAPSGNAWHLYSWGREDADAKKKILDWGMRVIKTVAVPEGREGDGEEEDKGLDDLLMGGD